ncbi:venom carboxylesterase-6-like isoform X2 [Cylas formicarius]|uniref:venom carboxylesterase-6-like isoform X2 n=1 Tax=Cylas formicarius TaxID=197179 RepID=UPI002958B3BA|nr:venom carboxylesterase-6-like isoform X2 [Cylas formicarius]
MPADANITLTSIVKTRLGQIKGPITKTKAGTFYASYLGIRYGIAPLGPLRFKAPLHVQQWSDIYDGTYEKGICYQVTMDSDLETEDCLMMNIYSPLILSSESDLLPVMFFIHGGGFVEGTSIIEWGFGPEFFMDSGVVLVAINYRVGPFGFLSTGDANIPGNAGLKDQLLALKFVNNYIQNFGGDPEKVTIFGHSAGSASVAYLMLNPESEGLYRAAICQSGSALSPWAYQRNHVNISYMTGALLHPALAKNQNSKDLLYFLREAPAKDIDEASANITQSLTNSGNIEISKGFYYTPVIEPDGDDAFLTEKMFEKFKNGSFVKVPVLMGVTSEESIYLTYDYNSSTSTVRQDYDNDHRLLVPPDMHVTDDNVKQSIGDLIKEFYVSSGTFQQDMLGTIRYHSNQDFDKAQIKQAELQSSHVPVYFYEFSYRGVLSNNDAHLEGTTGAAHGDEEQYQFTNRKAGNQTTSDDLSQFPETDRLVHQRLMTLWVNFARDLNPTPSKDDLLQNVTWPTVDKENFNYLEIGEDLKIKEGPPKKDMYSFWNNLYDTYARAPYDTF